MGHKIKIMPYSNVCLNLSITSLYNADFDGDEMNMHVAQSFEMKADVLAIEWGRIGSVVSDGWFVEIESSVIYS